MPEFSLEKALSGIDLSVEWIGLRELRQVSLSRSVRDGNPESNSRSLTHGVMVEVLVEGQFGYCCTNQLDQEGVRAAAQLACQRARDVSQWSLHRFQSDVRPQTKGEFRSVFEKPANAVSAKDMNELLLRVCSRLQSSDKIISTRASGCITEIEQRYVCSHGSAWEQHLLCGTKSMSVTAQEGDVVQTRSDGGLSANSFLTGAELFDEQQLIQDAERITRQVLELVAAPNCPSGTMPLVLAPTQMMLQIHESIGHAVELDRILGDERNFAGWSFVQPEDFGRLQYGSKLLNVTFDPTIPNQFASYRFDDHGAVAEKEYIIKDGLLLRGLGGRESQQRLGLPGVACARASSWNRAPIDRMANLNIEPGASSLDEIISSVERGVYMECNRSWSIDDYRRKFQFGCEYGRLIEGGKLTAVVRNPNYRGVSVPFWHSLTMVGNSDTFAVFGTPTCGKGEPNQLVRVGHGSPVCRFDNVEVFGGA